jgi:hypothetical protein
MKTANKISLVQRAVRAIIQYAIQDIVSKAMAKTVPQSETLMINQATGSVVGYALSQKLGEMYTDDLVVTAFDKYEEKKAKKDAALN